MLLMGAFVHAAGIAWAWAATPIRSLPAVRAVNGERAYGYLVAQCRFGPRNPGSAGHEAALRYLVRELRGLTDTVETMHFQPIDSHGRRVPPMTNIIARIAPNRRKRYLLCAHWDTRPRAEYDRDPARRGAPIIGANDGASGVAVLLEVANVLAAHPPSVGVDIALFDGEDYGEEGDLDDYCLGSREYARGRWQAPPELGVLVDMVGDRDLHLPVEQNSREAAPQVVERVWSAAARLGEVAFDRRTGPRVYDDHLPLIEAGWPVIDVIDFSYPYWHTQGDTPERCAPQSLAAVARVLVAVVEGY